MMLCDAAESVGGKLYILGGGWTQTLAGPPANMAVAVVVSVDWDHANVRRDIAVTLVDEGGSPVEIAGRIVENRGEFEMSTPPGVEPGNTLAATLALSFNGVVLPVGRYEWRLTIDEDVVDVARFRAVEVLQP